MGRLTAQVKDASVLVLNPSPIRGLSTAGGFSFVLQNRGGTDAAVVIAATAIERLLHQEALEDG